MEALEQEEDADARATELLVLGWLSTTTGTDRAKAIEVLRKPAKPSTLVAVCAVAGLVWLDERLSHEEVMVLVQHLRRTTKVPAVWGWVSQEGVLPGSGQLAENAVKMMKVAEGNRTAAEILTIVADTKPGTTYYALKLALARAAFDGQDQVALRAGLTLEDLDELRHKVLEALVANSRFTGSIFGLNEKALREMLEQKLPQWRPLDVTVSGKVHRWHFTRILGAVAFGEIEPDAARDLVLQAFTPAEAASLASSWSQPRLELEKTLTREEERARALAMCLGILDETKKAGEDVDALCRDYLKNMSADWGVLTLWSIHAHQGHPPEDHFPLFDAAMRRQEWHEPLLAAMRGLPAKVRTRLFHKASPWVLDFWTAALDEVTVPKLVMMTVGSKQRTPEVVAMLKAAGPEVVAMALAVTSDKPALESSIAAFREALRKA